MQRKTFQIEFFRDGIQIGHSEPFTGYKPNAEHFAKKRAHHSKVDFVRLLDEAWKCRQNAHPKSVKKRRNFTPRG